MLNAYDIIDTIKMIEEEHLDIRTVTMGISLVDCIRGSIKETADLIYDKITTKAKNLVPVAEGIGKEYGVPIVNKRVAVTPISYSAERSIARTSPLSPSQCRERRTRSG